MPGVNAADPIGRGASATRMDSSRRYKPSGKLGAGLLLTPLLSGFAIVIAAWLNAYATVHSPIVGWFSIVFVGVFTFVTAISIGEASRLAKVRSPLFTGLMGAIMGVVAAQANFAAFLHVVLPTLDAGAPGYFELLWEPERVWSHLQALSADGWYSLAGIEVKGSALLTLWTLEAITIVGVSTLLCWVTSLDTVYCEACGEWTEDVEGFINFEHPHDDAVLDQLRDGNTRTLLELPVALEGAVNRLRLNLQQCETCKETVYGQLETVTWEADADDNWSESSDELTDVFRMSADAVALLEARKAELPSVGSET